MASKTRSGKQPASEPEDGNTQDLTTASSNQQLAIRAFSAEQESALDAFKAEINANIDTTFDAKLDELNAKSIEMFRFLQQRSPAPPSAPLSAPSPASSQAMCPSTSGAPSAADIYTYSRSILSAITERQNHRRGGTQADL